MLCCKTRGNTAPAGKTKLYIIVRPEDREQYLDAVVRILLHIVNAAVYYDEFLSETSGCDFYDYGAGGIAPGNLREGF